MEIALSTNFFLSYQLKENALHRKKIQYPPSFHKIIKYIFYREKQFNKKNQEEDSHHSWGKCEGIKEKIQTNLLKILILLLP